MTEFSEQALNDDRYSRHRVARGLNIHPKEWFQCWGANEPIKWHIKSAIRNRIVELRLYPSYSYYIGWHWIGEERYKMRLKDQDQKEIQIQNEFLSQD